MTTPVDKTTAQSGDYSALRSYFPSAPICNYAQALKLVGTGPGQLTSDQLTDEVCLQGLCVFAGGFMLTAGYLLYENELGIFTLTTPFIIGGIGSLLFWLWICAQDLTTCLTNITDMLFNTLLRIVKRVWCSIVTALGLPALCVA